MDTAEQMKAYKMAVEHWNWLKQILDVQMILTEKLFKDAFVHGYKHKAKEVENGRDS